MGARGPRINMKSCHIIVRMPRSTDPRRKGPRGEDEMSQSTLWHASGSENLKRERERERKRIGDHRGNF